MFAIVCITEKKVKKTIIVRNNWIYGGVLYSPGNRMLALEAGKPIDKRWKKIDIDEIYQRDIRMHIV